MSRSIAITGLGAISPFGAGARALWQGLVAGRSAIARIERFDVAGCRSRSAALVPPLAPSQLVPAGVRRRLDPTSLLAIPAAGEALAQAGVAERERIGIVLGTNAAGALPLSRFLGTIAAEGMAAAPPILFPYTVVNAPASQCALLLGLRGPNITISQNEASSLSAIATSCRILRAGGADGLLACGADDLSAPTFEGYDRAGAISRDSSSRGGPTEGARPFDRRRNGFVLGEGAYCLYLETEERARGRGARILATIEGVGEGRGPAAPHAYPSDPAPVARTLAAALGAQNRTFESQPSVGVIVSSANGARALDALEAAALVLAFGDAPPRAVSVRGAIGESGASGAASVLATCFMLSEGCVPGTVGLEEPDGDLRLDVAADPRRVALERALVTGLSRGGAVVGVQLARGEE